MSNNIVAFTQRLDFKTLLEIECKVVNGFPPVVKDSVEEFESILSLMPDIQVAIIDEPKGKPDYKFLLDALSSQQTKIKNIVLLTKDTAPNEKCKTFTPESVSSMIEYLKSILSPSSANKLEYISVPIDTLIHFKLVPFDLYIKVGEDKFLKRIHANDDIDADTVKALKEKGVTELAFERKHNKDFSLMLLNNMINKVESDYSSEDAKAQATNEVFVTTKDIVRSVGLPPKVIEVCESVMERITSDVTKGKDKFSSYLSGMQTKKELSYQFRFVELTSFIATQMVELSGEAAKEEHIRTVVFCSFFCDIALKEASHLSYRSDESIKDLWPEDKTAIIDHALKAAEIVQKYKNAPADASEIIKQHHGALDGKGFPKAIPDSLRSLAKILFASQEIATALLNSQNSATDQVIGGLITKFKGSPIAPLLEKFQAASKG